MPRRSIVILPLLLAACVSQPPTQGPAAFAAYCADCHGAGATGNGPLASDLGLNAPDLTHLSADNDVVFPALRVMSKVDGYARRDDFGVQMPEFGALLAGPLVLVDYGDGVMTPTPEPLVALATYLQSLQR